MWKILAIGLTATGTLLAQTGPNAVDFANLREDVRGLSQRVGDLGLRVEQLERENNELRTRAGSADRSYATVLQLNAAIEDLHRTVRMEMAASKDETLQRVATQIEKLAQQTNAALDSLAKVQGARSPVAAPVAEERPKEGTATYTVQKGDTLALIAKKTGARQQDIITANKLTDPSHILVGQTLVIPNASSTNVK